MDWEIKIKLIYSCNFDFFTFTFESLFVVVVEFVEFVVEFVDSLEIILQTAAKTKPNS